jgi:hypothetical protein
MLSCHCRSASNLAQAQQGPAHHNASCNFVNNVSQNICSQKKSWRVGCSLHEVGPCTGTCRIGILQEGRIEVVALLHLLLNLLLALGPSCSRCCSCILLPQCTSNIRLLARGPAPPNATHDENKRHCSLRRFFCFTEGATWAGENTRGRPPSVLAFPLSNWRAHGWNAGLGCAGRMEARSRSFTTVSMFPYPGGYPCCMSVNTPHSKPSPLVGLPSH